MDCQLDFFLTFRLFIGKFPAAYLFSCHSKNPHAYKTLSHGCVVFLKLSFCATLHEDAIVQAIVSWLKVNFFLSVEIHVHTFDFYVKRIFEGLMDLINESVF